MEVAGRVSERHLPPVRGCGACVVHFGSGAARSMQTDTGDFSYTDIIIRSDITHQGRGPHAKFGLSRWTLHLRFRASMAGTKTLGEVQLPLVLLPGE